MAVVALDDVEAAFLVALDGSILAAIIACNCFEVGGLKIH
jgi:hypothetical protein